VLEIPKRIKYGKAAIYLLIILIIKRKIVFNGKQCQGKSKKRRDKVKTRRNN